MDWYYKDGDRKIGPISDEHMKQLAADGIIKLETKVWNEIISKWIAYGEIAKDATAAFKKSDKHEPPAQGNSEEPGWDPYSDVDSRCSIHDAAANVEDKPGRDKEATAICSICNKEIAWSKIRSSPRGLVCEGCMKYAESGTEPPHIAQLDAGSPGSHKFQFTGSGGEYFRIWIVNLLLSILTLGIYSAWAKVRKNQYFYRHTRVAGSSFDYHGNPIAILKGRIIAVVIIAILNFSKKLDPAIYGLLIILVIAAVPWMVSRAYAFRLYNTSWRSMRFHFRGTLTDAYIVFIMYGSMALFTLGICIPLFYQKMRSFLVNNAAFGTTRASLSVTAGDFYSIFVRTIGLAIGIGFVLSVALGIFGALTPLHTRSISRSAIIIFAISMVVFYFLYRLIVMTFFKTRIANLIWNHTSLGPVTFESTQRARDLASIVATNAFITLITFGFYWPWAQVQLAQYRADTMILSAQGSLEHFVTDTESAIAATSDELTEAFDVDFSF
ncbi:MAG TPA: DUF898 family protein [Dissulfurispiraceae bacterium]|nr:DUF898 family protein [Dissulfurispiraceae bacterium]